MFIDKDTLQRVNIYYQYKGFSKLDTPEILEAAGVIWIPDPVKPEDFNDDLHIWNDLDLPPYFKVTNRDSEQVAKTLATREKDAAQKFLNETDYLFTSDRHEELLSSEPDREIDLKARRATARAVIRKYKADYPEGTL